MMDAAQMFWYIWAKRWEGGKINERHWGCLDSMRKSMRESSVWEWLSQRWLKSTGMPHIPDLHQSLIMLLISAKCVRALHPLRTSLRETTLSLCLLQNCWNFTNSVHNKESFWFCECSYSGWILSRLPEDCQCFTSVSGNRYADYDGSMKGFCVINAILTY